MKITSLAFLFGILLLQNFIFLPKLYWALMVLPAVILLLFKKRGIIVNLLITSLIGFIWSLVYAHLHLDWTIPKELEGKTVQATGYVASLPVYSNHCRSFLFLLKKLNDKTAGHLIKISWMNNSAHLTVGDKWSLSVRLKRIHGLMNPGGFDYEAWAFQSGIRGQGYVVNKSENRLLGSHWYHSPLDRFRQFLQQKIENNLAKSNTSPWIQALIIGERHNIASKNWEVLRNTGTNHLMAIAGLHIGFMAGLTHKIIMAIGCRIPWLALRMPAQHVGAIGALLIAFVYSALAGFSIPTQRACIMLSVFLITVLLRRYLLSWQAWAMALILVLLINPLDVLTESFWLSFGSVALIIYGMGGRLKPRGWWWKWGRVQWVIALGLIPFSIWLFHQFSLIGFVANSMAIPWVAVLIVPLCLCGAFILLLSAKFGGIILGFADKLLAGLWWFLNYLSHLSWASWPLVMPDFYALLTSCMGMILLLLPAGFPGRYLGIIWLLPLICYKAPVPKIGEMWLTLLDVGQGLSCVLQTHNHLLVYDAGPRLSEGYDMGESVVTPFLYTLGTKTIDALVISHGDNDHIGGATSLLKNFNIKSIKTSVPEKFQYHAIKCLQGESWEWDRVQFKFLYPFKDNLSAGNDNSCVLRVTAGNNSILLPGDIEKGAENYLTDNSPHALAAQILVAPHHGSKTSIQNDFIQAVHPLYVLYGVGYRNRYHFPHPFTLKKYDALHACQLDTVTGGAIQIKIAKTTITLSKQYRVERRRYWNEK
jgi:competence protein ComEC